MMQFKRDGGLTETELVELESWLQYAEEGRANWYVPALLLTRLVKDNRRLRNLLLDYMDDE